MTAQKHLKQLVRSRMKKTGESYASARRQVIRQSSQPEVDPAARWHFPGNVAGTTALRVLLANAGIRDPHTGEPFSEAMLFGIAGGIGVGVFSFFYEKGEAASFFIAGRHSWHDHLAYLRQACERFGIKPQVKETAGAKAAEKQLRELLSEHGPCAAWVDMAGLPHRAMPAESMGYHIVTVYKIDEEQCSALIGDLADEPVSISLTELSKARARIKKDKNRLLAIPPSTCTKELATLVRDGLRACHQSLVGSPMKNYGKNFQLEAIRIWGTRLQGSKDNERWERIFAGPRLWEGLTSIYTYVEHYGTGGGLCRPLFADFLSEAADSLKDKQLHSLAERYVEVGRNWTELASAALPDDVPLFREAKELIARRAELNHCGAPVEEIRDVWKQLGELKGKAYERFPLSEGESAHLRADLQKRVLSLYEAEVAAHAALGEILG